MKACRLQEFELLQPILADFERWQGLFESRRVERGEVLWREGTPAKRCFFVLDGLMKIVTAHEDGHTTVVNIFGPGDCMGYGAVVRRIEYPATAVAVGRTELVSLTTQDLDRIGDVHPEFRQALLKTVIDCNQRLVRRIHDLGAGSVPHRMAAMFDDLVDRWGEPDGDLVKLPHLPRADLADLISVREETAIRLMRQWHNEGIVQTLGDHFIVDLRRLHGVLNA